MPGFADTHGACPGTVTVVRTAQLGLVEDFCRKRARSRLTALGYCSDPQKMPLKTIRNVSQKDGIKSLSLSVRAPLQSASAAVLVIHVYM